MREKRSFKILNTCLAAYLLLAAASSIMIYAEEIPEDPFQRGHYYLNKFKYAEARASFTEAIKEKPRFKAAFYYRGKCQAGLNELDAAMENFNKCLSLDEKYAPGYIGRAEVYIKKSNYTAAQEQLEKGFYFDPQNPEAFYQRGLLKGFLKQDAEAIAALNRCLELKPDHAYAHYHVGLAYYQQKRKDLTIAHLERFLQLAPETPEAPQVRNLLNFLKK